MTIPLYAKNLSKSYGDKQALIELDLNIENPGVYAILGQNGAGKTSLIKCALGLEKITSGEMKTMGHKPGALAAKEHTGVILQDTNLPDALTVKEQIELFASYYPMALSVEETISKCDLGSFAHKKYKALSGGQKRRAQFALAIVGDPQLIFLDEPTTGLDIEARRNLWQVIREFAVQGKTIVLTTHYLEEADNLADRIMVLNSGRIVANASPAEIHKHANGTVIRCQTALSHTQLQKLSSVTLVNRSGRFSEIRSDNRNQTLIDLLQLDPDVSDLTVSQAKLEDIFSELSSNANADLNHHSAT